MKAHHEHVTPICYSRGLNNCQYDGPSYINRYTNLYIYIHVYIYAYTYIYICIHLYTNLLSSDYSGLCTTPNEAAQERKGAWRTNRGRRLPGAKDVKKETIKDQVPRVSRATRDAPQAYVAT